EHGQVGIREVPVVVALLLAPHRTGFTPVRVPEEGFVDDRFAPGPECALTFDLEHERTLDVAERVHVLDLGLRAEALARSADRYVRVHPEAALLHVAVADLEVF